MRFAGLSGNGSPSIRVRGGVKLHWRTLLSSAFRLGLFLSIPFFSFFLIQADPAAARIALESEPARPSEPEPPRLHMTPSLDVNYEYDDNIFLRTFRRDSDFISRVRPGFSFLVEQERVRWSSDVAIDFAFYKDHPDLSTFNRAQTVDTRLTIRPTGLWTFDFADNFVHSIYTTEAIDLLFRRTEFFANTLSLRGAYRFSPRLTLEAEGINRATQFKDPTLIDVDENELRGAMTYLLTPLDKVTPEYRYRNFYFENRGTTEAHTAALRGEHRFTQTLTGRAMVGGLAIVDRGTVGSDLLFGLGAEQRYSAIVVFTADFLRDAAIVGGLSGAFITNTFSGAATFHVTQSFDSIVAGSWSLQQAFLSNRADVDTIGVRIEEQLKLTNWLKGIVGYTYRRQHFHDTSRDIYDNRVFIGLTAFTTYPPYAVESAPPARTPFSPPPR